MTVEKALRIYHELADSICCATYDELVLAEEILRFQGYTRQAHTVAENTPSQMSGDWDNSPERNEEA